MMPILSPCKNLYPVQECQVHIPCPPSTLKSNAVNIPKISHNLVRSSLGAPEFAGTAYLQAWYPAE